MDHVAYPHEPGRLYDCPACESECNCTGDPGHTPCVYCAILESAAGPDDPVTGECSHSPVAGMMHVHPEDLDAVAQMRSDNDLPPIICDDCDQVYQVGKGWTS